MTRRLSLPTSLGVRGFSNMGSFGVSSSSSLLLLVVFSWRNSDWSSSLSSSWLRLKLKVELCGRLMVVGGGWWW